MKALPSRAFFFVRHGQTESNAQGILCGGEWDVPLNPTGLHQAEDLAQKLATASLPITKLFVSPMLRAQQTAEVLNKVLGCPLETVEGLREWVLGEWTKRPWGEVPNPFNTTEEPPGGEKRADFEERVCLTVSKCLEQENEVPLLVAHGAVAHALFTFLGVDRTLIDNCGLYRVFPVERHWYVDEIMVGRGQI